MTRRALPIGLLLAGLLLLAWPAHAFPRSIEEVRALGDQLRPIHFFAAACFFGFFAIIGKYASWSGLLVILLAFLCVGSAGTFVVWALTEGVTGRQTASAVLMTKQVPAQPAVTPGNDTVVATAPAAAAAPRRAAGTQVIGGLCAANAECIAGNVCARVAGQNRCWPPCGKKKECPEGYACFPAPGQRVCVR